MPLPGTGSAGKGTSGNCRDTACRVLRGIAKYKNMSINTPKFHRKSIRLPEYDYSQAGSLSTIVRSYKSAVTRQINVVRAKNEPAIWQSRFYEHVIRNDKSYNIIRRYIIDNPLYWPQDDENPNRVMMREHKN